MAVPSGLGPRSILVAAALVSVAACTKSSDHHPAPAPSKAPAPAPAPGSAAVQVPAKQATQWYRAVFLRPPLPALPVYIQTPAQGASGVATLITGRKQA